MDYQILLKLTCGLGYELAMSGAETFRIEESINRILEAYGVQGESYSVPNLLLVSIIDQDGSPISRMQRVGFHSNDLDAVERFSGLSRAICQTKPEPARAYEMLQQEIRSRKSYQLPVILLADFIAALGFGLLFGAGWTDMLCAGVCGLIVGLVNLYTGRWKVNLFISTLVASFIMAAAAYTMGQLGLAVNADVVIIGALMLLVPGLLFTNAMRDFLYGDTNSGTTRLFQVLLIALAISLGTAAAFNVTTSIFGLPEPLVPVKNPVYITCLGAFLGCVGFSLLFNIHGPGGLLCMLGGLLTWAVYCLCLHLQVGAVASYFWASVFSAAYSEIMARIRKYPAISYLVVSLFPLIPGSDVYYTMNYAVRGNAEMFNRHGMFTAAVAGVMAIAILLVSTLFRTHSSWKQARLRRHRA